MITTEIIRPWFTRWQSTRWGFAYHSCHLWAAIGRISPADYLRTFHAESEAPIELIIVYRELVLSDTTEDELARRIVECTPEGERKHIVKHFLSPPEAFGSGGSANTVADQLGAVLRKAKLPTPEPADPDRIGGWRLLYGLWRRTTMLRGENITRDQAAEGPLLMVSSECPCLVASIPILTRDEKNREDVLKTSQMADSCGEALRILCKSMQEAKKTAPRAERRHLVYDSIQDPTSRAIAMKKFDLTEASKGLITKRKRWRS